MSKPRPRDAESPRTAAAPAGCRGSSRGGHRQHGQEAPDPVSCRVTACSAELGFWHLLRLPGVAANSQPSLTRGPAPVGGDCGKRESWLRKKRYPAGPGSYARELTGHASKPRRNRAQPWTFRKNLFVPQTQNPVGPLSGVAAGPPGMCSLPSGNHLPVWRPLACTSVHSGAGKVMGSRL